MYKTLIALLERQLGFPYKRNNPLEFIYKLCNNAFFTIC